jgi:hypothetical protein
MSVRLAWLPDRDLVVRPSWSATQQDRENVLWTTVMRVDDKLANPLDRWYLWHSTHDTPILRHYTAPAITGPWKEQPLCTLPDAPPGFNNGHRQAPDIVWDRATAQFVATPHSTSNTGRSRQSTWIMTSPDGRTWTRLSSTEIVPIGPDGAYDDYAIDYGRLLRDYDGNLVRVGGKAVFYFRGTQRVVSRDHSDGVPPNNVELFQLGAATTTDFVTWQKHGPLVNAGTQQLHALGSALWVNGQVNLIWSVTHANAAPQMYLLQSTGSNPLAFPQGPGVPLYQDPSLLAEGGSYAIDRATGTHYMVYGTRLTLGVAGTPLRNQAAVRLIRSPIGPMPV